MADMYTRIVKMRRAGKSYAQISAKVGLSHPTICGHLKRAGLVNMRSSKRKAPKNTNDGVPVGLNGLSGAWRKADKLISKAKQIKAAIKVLHKAMHG